MNDKVLGIIYIYSDLVLYTQKITLNSEQFTYEDVTHTYSRLLSKITTKMSEASICKYDKPVLLAYVAWVDEKIMLSNVNFKKQWMENLLQKKYFQTSSLGNEFFIHYNNLEDDNKNTKAIYLYVLSLGFKGKYLIDKNGLEDFIKEELTAHNTNIEVDYFNKIYDLNTPTLKPIKKVKFIKLGYLVFIVIISLLFIITMHFYLENELDSIFTRFENIK